MPKSTGICEPKPELEQKATCKRQTSKNDLSNYCTGVHHQPFQLGAPTLNHTNPCAIIVTEDKHPPVPGVRAAGGGRVRVTAREDVMHECGQWAGLRGGAHQSSQSITGIPVHARVQKRDTVITQL